MFRLKLKALLHDLTIRALGVEGARMHAIVFQKRGLPHAHLLMILAEEDKPQTPEDYDKFMSTELPDPVTCPQLYQTVQTCMMYGPCGAADPAERCMKDGKCTNGFPKPFCDRTHTENGFPQYRRRNKGRTVNIQRVELTNRCNTLYYTIRS